MVNELKKGIIGINAVTEMEIQLRRQPKKDKNGTWQVFGPSGY